VIEEVSCPCDRVLAGERASTSATVPPASIRDSAAELTNRDAHAAVPRELGMSRLRKCVDLVQGMLLVVFDQTRASR